MANVTIDQVADYFLWSACQNGDLITNLKLQKLVYYAQAWFLALYEEPLFNDEFQAWVHGPVNTNLYHRFKDARWQPINCDPFYSPDSEPNLPQKVKAHLDEIIDVFFDYSAHTLERMTHNEDPWINARQGLPQSVASNNIISKSDMMNYYKSL